MEASGTFNADVRPLTLWRPSVCSGKKKHIFNQIPGFLPVLRQLAGKWLEMSFATLKAYYDRHIVFLFFGIVAG